MRYGQFFNRVIALVAGVVFITLLIRVIFAILKPIVPATVVHIVALGGQMLVGFLLPALPAVAALGLLYGFWWLFARRR
jgi:hypothetical protein